MFAKVNILMIKQRKHYCWLNFHFLAFILYKKLHVEPIFIYHTDMNLSIAITVHGKAFANHWCWQLIALLFHMIISFWMQSEQLQEETGFH